MGPVKESLEDYIVELNDNEPPVKNTSSTTPIRMLNHETSKIDPNSSEKDARACRAVGRKDLDNKGGNTGDETENAGTRSNLVGTVDSDDTGSSGRSHWGVGGSRESGG